MKTRPTNHMKFYLAGKWSDKENLVKYVNELEKTGMHCTHRWMEWEGATLGEMATNDVIGVLTADMVVIIMDDPEYAYRGSFTELGVALATNKEIYIINPNGAKAKCSTNCFYHHPAIVHFKSWDQFLNHKHT